MESVKELIRENSAQHPEFEYYLPLIDKAERNSLDHPDICIEVCKSLLEGISKSIVERISDNHTRADLDKKEVGPLVKLAVKQLKQHDDVIEDDFVTRCTSMAVALGTLRNARGDISHGRGVPKGEQSNDKLALLSMQMSSGLLHYMLEALFAILGDKEVPVEVEEPEEALDLEVVEYEANPDFNAYLDEETPVPGRILYSLALYEQYYEDYLIQLSEYQYEQEVAESGDNE